jgi:hypothetical protein
LAHVLWFKGQTELLHQKSQTLQETENLIEMY